VPKDPVTSGNAETGGVGEHCREADAELGPPGRRSSVTSRRPGRPPRTSSAGTSPRKNRASSCRRDRGTLRANGCTDGDRNPLPNRDLLRFPITWQVIEGPSSSSLRSRGETALLASGGHSVERVPTHQ
jgi:hypothetical protein